MGFKRKYKANYRTGYTPRRRNTIGNKKKWILTKAMKDAMGIELKFFDNFLINGALTAVTDSTAGEHNPSATSGITTVAQGDSGSNRDGRRLTMKSILVQGFINIPAQDAQASIDDATTVFIALVLDKQTNGIETSSEQIFTNPGANVNTSTSPFLNLTNSKRFRILRTLKMNFGVQATYSTDNTNVGIAGIKRHFSMYHSFGKNGLTQNYTNTTGVIGSVSDTSVSVIAFTSNVELAPTISYNSRLRFYG